MTPSHTTKARPAAVTDTEGRRPPIRTCVACRQTAHKAHLIRIVCGPSGHLVVDRAGKLPGRGVYVCPQRACLTRALGGTRLRAALRQEVVSAPVDEFIPGLVRTLEECAVACVHVARKAGRAVSGYAQVMRALAHEPVALLLVAADTAPERRRHYSEQCLRRQIPSRPFLSKTRLGALVGREESSAIGILEPRLAERLIFYLEAMSRLTER